MLEGKRPMMVRLAYLHQGDTVPLTSRSPMGKFGMYNKFTAHPGQRDRLVEQLLSAAKLMENATGCELYIVNTSPNEADIVWVTEVWESEEDHRASLSIEGVPELIERTMPLVAGPPEQIRVVPVGGKGLVV